MIRIPANAELRRDGTGHIHIDDHHYTVAWYQNTPTSLVLHVSHNKQDVGGGQLRKYRWVIDQEDRWSGELVIAYATVWCEGVSDNGTLRLTLSDPRVSIMRRHQMPAWAEAFVPKFDEAWLRAE